MTHAHTGGNRLRNENRNVITGIMNREKCCHDRTACISVANSVTCLDLDYAHWITKKMVITAAYHITTKMTVTLSTSNSFTDIKNSHE